jgi:Tfp pilus assembly protein PilF
MSNKNPFEIRAEMLQLAKEYMDTQYHMNIEFAEKALEAGRKSVEDVQDMYKMYSMEDLMEKAKEMYSFVSKKD